MTKKTRHSNTSPKTAQPHGFDGSGHLPSAELRYLLERARATRTADSNEAFVTTTLTDDDLAEELAEAAVMSMTSGQDELTEAFETDVDEDRGGPFVETSASTEFAGGTDESNIAEATREPFPRANGSGKP